ncbi:MAG: glycosyltransferase [Erysipelotrichales bacterium]|nr:glycosyltransferase [Erysipelotrichales bacterium]
MRIGIFTDGYRPHISGVATSIVMLEEGLRALGHEVYVITTGHRKAVEPEPNVIRIKGYNLKGKKLPDYQYKFFVRRELERVKKLNLDIIHIHTEFSIGKLGRILSKKTGIKTVYTFHTMYEDYLHYVNRIFAFKTMKRMAMPFVRRTVRKAVKRVDEIIVPTQKVLDMMIRYKVRGNFNIIPSGLDLSKFKKDTYTSEEVLELKKSLGIEDEEILLFLGRISKEKAVDIIVEEFAKLEPDKKRLLVIVGHGPYEENIKQLIKDLKLNNVLMTGSVPWEKVGLYYQLADIFVNASTTETQGLTYVEALAASLPLVVKYDDSIKDLITDYENGLFFRENGEFATKIKELEANPELKAKLAENASLSIEKYSQETYAKTVLALYEKILDE